MMVKIATFSPPELLEPGNVRIIAKLLNDRQTRRHVQRLARRLHCGYGVPLDHKSPEPLTLNRWPEIA
jgi:hypothetical protein